MEVIYSIDIKSSSLSKDWISEEKCCCSLSCQNVVAISRQCGEEKQNRTGQTVSIQYEIGVFDLDKPWEWYTITSTQSTVTNLEWDRNGVRLLIADADGLCQVWKMENFLINKWTCLGSSSLTGEEILAVSWFHTGLQISFNPEKKDTVMYSDKFHRVKFMPSLTEFGGKPLDGWVCVTASGLVNVGIINQQEPYLTMCHKSFSQNYLRLSLASISHSGSGDIMVATSDGQLSTAIQCYSVSVQLCQGALQINCKPSASLFMKKHMDFTSSDNHRTAITHVQFLNSETSDTLILCCGSYGSSTVEIWQLIEQHMPLHKMCQMNVGPDAGYKIPKWMHNTTINHKSYLTSIASPKLPMLKSFMETGFSPYIATAYKDGTIKLIHRYTYQVLHTTMDALRGHMYGQSPNKKAKTSTNITNLVQTMCGCGLIAVYDDRLSVLKVYNSKEGGVTMSALYVCLLLEYAMVTGQDWWGILLAVKPGNIEGICQKLVDNYMKQPVSMQELVQMRLLALKVALYSINMSSQHKAVDCHARLVLQAINVVFRSLLRPKTVTSQDKSPAEKLSILCQKTTDGDLENLLVNLEPEEFLIDTRKKDKGSSSGEALQSLQPLIQWVADFSLHLLASIPLYQSYTTFPGSILLSDCVLLNMLRELLVVIRIWGVIQPSSLPTFTTTSNVDCLAYLFKVMTKAWLCCKEGAKLEYDETLLDECCILPSKVLVPSMNQSFCLNEAGYTVFSQQSPLLFSFHEPPEYLYIQKKSKIMYVSDVLTENRQHHDIVRQIHLGAKLPEGVKQCCRCGGYSLLHSIGKSPIIKAWEQRWQKHCLCGGHWKLLPQEAVK